MGEKEAIDQFEWALVPDQEFAFGDFQAVVDEWISRTSESDLSKPTSESLILTLSSFLARSDSTHFCSDGVSSDVVFDWIFKVLIRIIEKFPESEFSEESLKLLEAYDF